MPASRHSVTRREFAASCLSPLVVGACAGTAAPPPSAPRSGDLHVHLFGMNEAETGCRLSPTIRRSATFVLLVRTLQLPFGAGLDRAYAERLLAEVRGSGIDQVAIVGQDGVYDDAGRLVVEQTHFFVPNDYVFGFCAQEPSRLRACPSLNPMRRDAIDELERCVALGARMLKIHPPTQGVDLADPRHVPFFRRCAELDVLVLVHTGHEHSAPVIDIGLADPRKLEAPLAAGCRVVACHAGTGRPTDHPDFLPDFVAMLRRHPRLLGDTAILCTVGRDRDLFRLCEDPAVRERLVHGSDYPFPSMPIVFAAQLDRPQLDDLVAERNLLVRDRRLKTALGLGASVELAGQLLA